MLDLNLIPNKLLDVCDFVKTKKGCIMYSSYLKPELKNTLVIRVTLEDFEIDKSFRIPSKVLDVARKLVNAEIELTDSLFIVKNEKSRFANKLLNNDTFVEPNEIEYDSSQTMNIKNMINACDYVSKLDKKPILKGVYLTDTGNIYATDSYSVYYYDNNDLEPAGSGIVIPPDFIRTVSQLIGTEEVTIKFNSQKVIAEKDNIAIESVLYAGEYPNVNRIISNLISNYNLSVNSNTFDEALDYINYIECQNDQKPLVKLERNSIKLSGENQFTSEIDFDVSWTMKLDAAKLQLALKTIGSGSLDCYVLKNHENVGQMLMLTNQDKKESVIILGIISE